MTAAATAGAAGLPLKQVARVGLPGPGVRFDYVSIDPGPHRLYIAHMDASELLVFDLRARRAIRTIHAPGVHGVLAVPQLQRVFASATDDHELLTLDLKRLRFTGSAGVGGSPDVLALDPGLHRLYVAAESGEVAVFAEGQHAVTKLGQSYLAPEAHSVAVDPRTHLAYFPLQVDARHGPELLIMAPS